MKPLHAIHDRRTIMTQQINDELNEQFEKDAQLTSVIDGQLAQITQQQLQLSEKVGALKATGFFKKVGTVTEIKLLAEIKETKQYKGLRVCDIDGNWLHVTTWADFCKSLGYSREKIDQDILNLSTFGEDFLETSQRMGVGYRDLRKLRQLPDDARDIIINGEAVQAQDKESIIELIEDMSVKYSKDKEELEKKLSDEKAERKATDKVIANKNKKIDELEKQLARRENASPYERATDLAQEISTLEGDFLTTFAKIDKLFSHINEDDELPEVLRVNRGQLLLAIKDHADSLIDKYQLGDISVNDDSLNWQAELEKDMQNGSVPDYVK